ncbi:MAG: ATP-binding cassette domain-containing protein [Verrucomicrobia bacterium]|nr:ATP-binding cassette domain-containing protein [Verrucomicrobiota bacterium]
MNGNIVIRNQDELRAFALEKSASKIGSGPSADLVITAPGMEPHHATLTWEPRASTWLLSAASPDAARSLSLNGRACPVDAVLEDGDLIGFPGGVIIRFGVTPSMPRFGGSETSEIPLRGISKIIVGRASGEVWGDSGKVQLDPDDSRISRNHLELEQTTPGVIFANDKSSTGTLLNGQRFDRRRLIVGDRLRLGGYNFEFTGMALRLVAGHGGAKVEARNLTLQLRDGRKVLDDISLDIAPSSFVGIIGNSGQSQGALLHALCGVNPATSGQVYINGAQLDDPRAMALAGIGYVPQDDIVHCELTVTEVINHSARLKLPSNTPRAAMIDLVEETIERMGLSAHKHERISQLSSGQRKRVSIAVELLSKPSVLFLDEPSNGLDPESEFDLMGLLRRLTSLDCTVVCATQVRGGAYLFDQLCCLHDGQLIFNGTPDEANIWFKVKNSLEEIHQQISAAGAKTGADWRQEFENSHAGSKPLAHLAPANETTAAKKSRPHRTTYLSQIFILLRRQWSIFQARPRNLLLLLAQPLFIGLLIGCMLEDAMRRMFFCVVATLWLGCSNIARQIVREIAIFRRERNCGLRLNSYLQSKYVFLTFITTLQALLLLVFMLMSAHVFNPGKFNRAEFYQKMEARLTPAAGAQPSKYKSKLDLMLDTALFFETGQNLLDATEPSEKKAYVSDASASALTALGIAIGLRLAALYGAVLAGVATGLAISARVRTETQAVTWVVLIFISLIIFSVIVIARPEIFASVPMPLLLAIISGWVVVCYGSALLGLTGRLRGK